MGRNYMNPPEHRSALLQTTLILAAFLALPSVLQSCERPQDSRLRAAKLSMRARELMFSDQQAEAMKLFDQAKALDRSSSFAAHGSVWARLTLGQ